MTGYFALLRLQLLSRYADWKPRNLKAKFQEKRGRTIGTLIATLFAVAYLGGALIFLENAMLNFLMQIGMPDLLLSMAVTLSMLGTLIMSFFFIMSALYFGRDSGFIASLPVKPRTVLSAKLTQVWISEVGFSLVIILVAAVLYGIRMGADALFYLRALLVALAAPMLPIVIVTLISTLLIRLSALWKHRDMIATASGILFIGAYMYFAMNMGSMTGSGEADNLIARFLESNTARIDALTRMFPPAAWAAKGLLGDLTHLLLFLLVCALAAGLIVWALGGVYQKLSMLQGETATGTRKKKREKVSFSSGSAFLALCRRELRQILRVPSYATNSLPTAFMPVFMVVMMYVIISRSLADEGMNLTELLSGADTTLALPILAAVMAYMAGMNPALSTSVSREGRGHDFLTSLPLSARTHILAKMAVGYGLSLIGCLIASVLIVILLPGFAVHAVLAFVLCALYVYMTSALALTRDVKHPRLDWVTEQEAIKQNTGAAVSLFMGWGILIALAGITYLLLHWGVKMYAYAGIMSAILACGAYACHRHLMKTADTYYCRG